MWFALLAVSAGGVIVVDLPAARWVEKKGYCGLSLVFSRRLGGGFLGVLAFPCFHGGLLALPLCGAAPTFFACCKESRQRKQLYTASS
jgi:hypothetical protein